MSRAPASLAGVALLAALVGAGAPAAAAPTVSSAATTETCTVADATITWGFKESFRSYISGTIANGAWEVSEGATYETPDFGFVDGVGTYAAQGSRVEFGGAIRFTGHGGILDTTVSNPVIEWSGHEGTLFLDVSGTTQAGDPVDAAAVPFATLAMPDPGVDGDPRVFGGIGATLTDEGSAAFGTYEPGEVLDPITLDLGTVDDGVEESCALLTATSSTTGWIVAGAIAGVLAAIAIVVIVMVRRRRAA